MRFFYVLRYGRYLIIAPLIHSEGELRIAKDIDEVQLALSKQVFRVILL